MIVEHHEDLILYDHEPTVDTFASEVLDGLRQTPKRIPSKFFYDERGSQLFEEITKLDEYYLTRTELSILRAHLPDIAGLAGAESLVIEFGTGAGIKTRLLLEALERPAAYVPIDISREQLLDASLELIEAFPDLEVWPVCADYTEAFELPKPHRATKQTLVFFPGSTIGNFTPEEAASFLRSVVQMIGPHGSLLIGFDRRKDSRIIEAAYNDRAGVTAAFNLNLITRIANEFHADINASQFEHYAFFNEDESRIEMHLISRETMSVTLGDEQIHFEEGEHIVTEYSYKYSRDAFCDMLEAGGFICQRRFTDVEDRFDLWYCKVRT